MANEQNKENTQNSSSTSSFGSESSSTTSSSTTGSGQNQNFGSGTSSSSTGSGSGGSGTSAKQAKDDNASTSGSSSSGAVDTVKDTAKGVLSQAKETAGQAYGVAAEKATTKIEEHKATLAGGLTNVADSLKQVGGSLREGGEENPIAEFTAKYGDSLANQIEKIGSYFDNKDVREMVRDVESFARRNPAVFLGAAFGLGLLAARFLKSSPKQLTASAERSSFSGNRSESTTNPS